MTTETPAAGPERVELDPAALARLRDIDPDGRNGVLRRVLLVFEASLSHMLVQLGAEREGGDASVVASVAHMLKSSAASVGALALSQTCAEVEQRLRTGQAGSLAGDIERMCQAGQAALEAVKAMLQS